MLHREGRKWPCGKNSWPDWPFGLSN
jgi:hypothetical protein